ncbi:MAG TPA: hypothetical protein V6C72_05355 [Chroococcales cyanobacterium]
MRNDSQGTGNKRSPLKLVLFAAASVFVLGCLFFWLWLWPMLGPLYFSPQYMTTMREAVKLWNVDRARSKDLLEKAAQSCQGSNASIAEKLRFFREYARFLYANQEDSEGDRQIERAVTLVKGDPPPGSAEADELTHAYQDRGWSLHDRYLVAPKNADPGLQDQEKSVAVAEKAFGADHEQTVYKIPSLSVIYGDIGQPEKADALMKRALTAVDTNAGAKQCAWFVYAMAARLNAVEHNYKEGLKYFLKARSVSSDDSQRERAWTEFRLGLTHEKSRAEKAQAETARLFSKNKFEELDQIGDRLLKSQEQTAQGKWALDDFITELAGENSGDTSGLVQHIYTLKNWLKKNSRSVSARVALAQAQIKYGWQLHGNNHDNVTEAKKKLLIEHVTEAQSLLDAVPGIKKTTPAACTVYLRVAVGLHKDKAAVLKIIDETHRLWPNYHNIDWWATYFLMPFWYGDHGESAANIEKLADAVGGARGDELYAQLAWFRWDDEDDEEYMMSAKQWQRFKKGFARILADFPHDMKARIEFIKFALRYKDESSMEHIFDSFSL